MSTRPRSVGSLLARLASKELRESMRDRRTIVTLFLMPLLLYPLLSVAFQKFLLTQLGELEVPPIEIGVLNERDHALLQPYLKLGLETYQRRVPPPPPLPEIKQPQVLNNGFDGELGTTIDVGLRVTQIDKVQSLDGTADLAFDVELAYTEASLHSIRARDAVLALIEHANGEFLNRRLAQLRVSQRGVPVRTVARAEATAAHSGLEKISSVVPLILVLMTITGAVYPAIDLTAGERERGTLEVLMAAPVPRLSLLLGKYIAVLSIAVLTATINLAAMVLTVLSSGLGPQIFGPQGMSWLSLLEVFGLLSMFAAFFSAVLLTLTSFARSFKEAQAYLIPLMIFSLAPGLVSLMPGLALRGWVLITPLLNMTLLARDVLRGQAQLDAALIVLGSTLFFAGAAVSLASRVFGADAVLYGSQSSLADLFVRPARTRPAATVGSALLCLAVVFPMIVLTSSLPQLFPLSINVRLSVNALTLLAALGGLPLLWAWQERIEWGTGFGVRPARGAAWAAAALLGASLWTFAYEAIVWRVRAQWINADALTQRPIEELFAQLKVNASPVLLILSLAVIPALVEEFFFRGLLLTSLKHRFGNWTAVLVSAIVFGMFHIIGAFGTERVIPSTILGLVLGAMRLRSGSLFPGMLLHAVHNSLLTLALWLQSRPAGGAGEPLESPLARIIQQTGENVGSLSPIVLGAAVGAVVLGGLLLALSRPVRDEEV